MRDCFFASFLTAQIGLAHHSSFCTQLRYDTMSISSAGKVKSKTMLACRSIVWVLLLQCLLDSSKALLAPSPPPPYQHISRVGHRQCHPHISTRHISAASLSNNIVSRGVKRSHHQSSTSLAATDERKPWELFRFISQSSKFVTLPPLPFAKSPVKRKIVVGEFSFVCCTLLMYADKEDSTINICTYRRNYLGSRKSQ
jgi:hypothetical protein